MRSPGRRRVGNGTRRTRRVAGRPQQGRREAAEQDSGWLFHRALLLKKHTRGWDPLHRSIVQRIRDLSVCERGDCGGQRLPESPLGLRRDWPGPESHWPQRCVGSHWNKGPSPRAQGTVVLWCPSFLCGEVEYATCRRK